MRRLFFIIPILFSFFIYTEAEESPPVIHSSSESYTVIKQLGSGYCSHVFLVEDSQGSRFALKAYKLHQNESYDPFLDQLMQVEREFARSQILNHQNILKAHSYFLNDFDNEKYFGYLVMELVEGSIIAKTPRYSLSQQSIVALTTQFVAALEYANSFGLIHLDLHEGNVMVDNQSGIKVIDLASFFTFEEIKGFFNKSEIKKSSTTQLKSTTLPVVREKQLNHFFSKNPELFSRIKSRITDDKKRSLTGSDLDAEVRKAFEPYYFREITEMCNSIVSKSDFNKQEKLATFAKIKTVSWDFQESLKDGEEVSFKEYSQKLLTVLFEL